MKDKNIGKVNHTDRRRNAPGKIRLPLFLYAMLLPLFIGCPMLATMETAEITKKAEYPSHYITGDAKQFDLSWTSVYGIPQDQGPIRVGPVVPIIEGKVRWVLINDRMEFILNAGSSGLGLGTKILLLKSPLKLATKFSVSGLPTIIQNSPIGCYALDLIGSAGCGTNTTLYGGSKFVSWFDLPALTILAEVRPLYPVDPYFDAAGGFIGIKTQYFTIELGCYYVFDKLENYWGVQKGYIPVFGISIPMKNDD
jgi:hypothetical protein